MPVLDLDKAEMPTVDLALFDTVSCLPHKFIVAPSPRPETTDSGFYLPDRARKRERPPTGIVVAAGRFTGLSRGDEVLVDASYAKVVYGLCGYPGEVWLFGLTSPHVGSCQIVGAEHTAIAKLREDRPYYPGRLRDRHEFPELPLKATGDRVVLKLPPRRHEVNGVVLCDHMADRPDEAVVCSIGNALHYVQPGDRVLILRRGLEALYPEGLEDVAIASEKAIYAVF